MMPRLIEAYMTYIAAIKAGFVVIPSSEMLRKRYRISNWTWRSKSDSKL